MGQCQQWIYHKKGRILICWNPDIVKLENINIGNQIIMTEVTHKVGISFTASFVYGFNSYNKRRKL
ncbi:hypothetical protein GIB67_020681 [Kingdonia uniflora]|uniref:Uncharacterized protein n=1 Tax=Kingdonia uniflora TaxID=39325 RepID=A0A7J7NJL0_9MAGN|nr:hypothetical protein GIB67_020681 [Kingdonia uniflora]